MAVTPRFASVLVGNSEDRFSNDAAHIKHLGSFYDFESILLGHIADRFSHDKAYFFQH